MRCWSVLYALRQCNHCTTLYANGAAITAASGAKLKYRSRAAEHLVDCMRLGKASMKCLGGQKEGTGARRSL